MEPVWQQFMQLKFIEYGRYQILQQIEDILIQSNPLTNLEIQKYCQNEPKFNGAASRENLPKIQDAVNITNLPEDESIGTYWIALHVNVGNVTYFYSFGVEHIPKEIIKFMENKSTITNIYRILAYDSIMCGYFYSGFTDLVLKGKSLLQYTNLFSRNEYKKNGKTILKHFEQNVDKLI